MKRTLSLLAVLPVLLTGCAGASGTQAKTSGGLVKITVANLAVTSSADLVLGVQKGFFRQEGLDVTLKDTPAASTQAAVVSGQAQFAFTNVPALLAAASNGLPVRVVGPAGKFPSDVAKTYIQVVAPKGSPIKSAKDLEGRRMAVDTLYQLPHLSFIISARKLGVDTSKIKFVETPYPAMADALAKKQVDAADLGEPFLSPELAKGGRMIMTNGSGFSPGTVQTMWVTSAPFLAKNRATVDKFTTALKKANEYAAAHPEEVQQVVPSYTKTTAGQAKTILMPAFSPSMDRKNFEIYYTTMKGLGVIKKDVDLNSLIVQ